MAYFQEIMRPGFSLSMETGEDITIKLSQKDPEIWRGRGMCPRTRREALHKEVPGPCLDPTIRSSGLGYRDGCVWVPCREQTIQADPSLGRDVGGQKGRSVLRS